MNGEITFTATGDSFITRLLPAKDNKFHALSSLLRRAEVRFTNLETTIHEGGEYPAASSGGTWAFAPPEVLSVLADYGFNLLGWANNHTLDYCYGGVKATETHLNESGFVHAGAGSNLAAASAPRYLETASGRVALIAATSTCEEYAVAGEQRRDNIGRPGVNPLRYQTTYVISEEQMQKLKEIADITGINSKRNLDIKEGFLLPEGDGAFVFGNNRFKIGDNPGCQTRPEKNDLSRILNSIDEAKRRSDYVIISLHAHEMGDSKEQPAAFIREFAHRCIDRGAHAIIGHGPHVLRGIEIYKQRPIFYSLGNFIFQTETVKNQPHDFYQKYGLGPEDNIADALDAMNDEYRRGLYTNPACFRSLLPLWQMEEGRLIELKLYPLELGFEQPVYRMGWPRISRQKESLREIKELSVDFGTDITILDNRAEVVLE